MVVVWTALCSPNVIIWMDFYSWKYIDLNWLPGVSTADLNHGKNSELRKYCQHVIKHYSYKQQRAPASGMET